MTQKPMLRGIFFGEPTPSRKEMKVISVVGSEEPADRRLSVLACGACNGKPLSVKSMGVQWENKWTT
jgi:hypothetical protein